MISQESNIVADRVLARRVVPVVVIDDAALAVPLAEALLAGGLDLIEITFRTAAAESAIRNVARALPQMMVGAGTLLEPAQVRTARDAGAKFGVAPGLNEEVVRAARELGLTFLPGVMTPSEVERGLALGCQLQKFFPAEVAGGAKMLKALAGPYAHTGLRFIPLGGVNSKNAPDYLSLPIVAAIGGSWIAERRLISTKNWSEITRLAREALGLAKAAQS